VYLFKPINACLFIVEESDYSDDGDFDDDGTERQFAPAGSYLLSNKMVPPFTEHYDCISAVICCSNQLDTF